MNLEKTRGAQTDYVRLRPIPNTKF
jgi:hypothetical protein